MAGPALPLAIQSIPKKEPSPLLKVLREIDFPSLEGI
jgi:hypothetical protein